MKIAVHLTFMILFLQSAFSQNFASQQKNFERVRKAYTLKEKILSDELSAKGLNLSNMQMFIRIFKQEETVEIWVKKATEATYNHFKDYKICAGSGGPGPKRARGDGQVPEGFYYISRFNPASNYYLSLGLNYPNSSDKILGNKTNPGGDIFIHGNCVTIGCIPITDDKIMEVYLLAVQAKNNGQDKIPVHIFPCRMNDTEVSDLEKRYEENKTVVEFWKNIRTGYDYFEKSAKVPDVSVETNGKYKFK